MLWFFERDEERIRVETRYDEQGGTFIVTMHWPDGRDELHRFDAEEACRTWLRELEAKLRTEAWTQDGPPIILPYGWSKSH